MGEYYISVEIAGTCWKQCVTLMFVLKEAQIGNPFKEACVIECIIH